MFTYRIIQTHIRRGDDIIPLDKPIDRGTAHEGTEYEAVRDISLAYGIPMELLTAIRDYDN